MKKERQSISELQEVAVTALNELQKALKKGNYKTITPVQMLSLAFRVADDEKSGFRFLSVDLTDADYLKYQEPDKPDPDGSYIITSPSKPELKDISGSTNKPKIVNRGVRLE